MARRSLLLVAAAWWLGACGRGEGATRRPADSLAAGGSEPPVALDAEPPVTYPPDLYTQGVEGTVELRLYVTEEGAVVPESTRVSSTSGYPAFDSAAVSGVARMRFAPARQNGAAVAAVFTQPVHFRRATRPAPSP